MNIKIRRIPTGAAPFLPGALAILLAFAIIASPESSFEASLQGVKLWWTLVFPALLPFLILSEMLTASGFVHAFGVLLEPLMTRVFRLPGASGWTLVQGITAGFPGGAAGALQLHKQGSLSGKETGRLAALVHFASPVTLLVVVGTALLHSPAAGYGLLFIHWLAGIIASLTPLLLSKRKSTGLPQRSSEAAAAIPPLYTRVQKAAADARARDGRSFGKLLGDSVTASVQNLMIVGGYMIMFAVIINICTSLWPALPAAIPSALLEMHLGAQALSGAISHSPLAGGIDLHGMALLSAALGWSGLCAQMQVHAVLHPAKVKFLPAAGIRLLHGLWAYTLTWLLWKPLLSLHEAALPALAGMDQPVLPAFNSASIWELIPRLAGLQLLFLLLLLLGSGIVSFISVIRHRLS